MCGVGPDKLPSTCNRRAGRGGGSGCGVGRGAFLGACHKLDLEGKRKEKTCAKLFIHILLPASGRQRGAPDTGGTEKQALSCCVRQGEASEGTSAVLRRALQRGTGMLPVSPGFCTHRAPWRVAPPHTQDGGAPTRTGAQLGSPGAAGMAHAKPGVWSGEGKREKGHFTKRGDRQDPTAPAPAPRGPQPLCSGSGHVLEATAAAGGHTNPRVGRAGALRPSVLSRGLVTKGTASFSLRAKFLFPKGSRTCCLGRSGA